LINLFFHRPYGYRVSVDFTISQYRDEIFPLTHQDTLDVESMVRPTVQIPAHLAPMAIYFNTHEAIVSG